nr:SLC13 family permease [uncultured Gardnerella sp.]
MKRWLLNLVKCETILIVAAILAVISCFFVPPDSQYWGYIHVNTISQLICLMMVVCGFQRIGVFRAIGARLLRHVRTERGLVLVLMSLTFFSAMFITNDVALVTFVPFALSVLVMANAEKRSILVITLMTIGANVGSMLTPIGNAHNLYLKALTHMSTKDFLKIMSPYTVTAAVLMIAFAFVFFKSRKVDQFAGLHGDDIEQSVLAPSHGRPQPDEIRVMGYGMSFTRWRVIVYSLLFVVCLCGVSGWIPDWIMVVIMVVAFLLCDRHVFRVLDWALPLTFIMFFIFIGNMRRVPGFSDFAQMWVGSHPMEVSIASSQFISNVPTTILLSGFCDQWKMLIIGTNLGGMGTLIASMASLISYKGITNQYPEHRGRYLLTYTIVNVFFLAVLMSLAWIIE